MNCVQALAVAAASFVVAGEPLKPVLAPLQDLALNAVARGHDISHDALHFAFDAIAESTSCAGAIPDAHIHQSARAPV